MHPAASVLALLLALSAATAANAQSLNLRDLARRADLIAFGHCQAAESSWDEQHRFIVTTIRFQPQRIFKGSAADAVTVKLLGGHVGTEGMIASPSAAMATGEDSVLFLERSRFGNYFVVTGGAEGKLSVQTDNGSGRTRIGGALTLDDFGQWLNGITGSP